MGRISKKLIEARKRAAHARWCKEKKRAAKEWAKQNDADPAWMDAAAKFQRKQDAHYKKSDFGSTYEQLIEKALDDIRIALLDFGSHVYYNAMEEQQ